MKDIKRRPIRKHKDSLSSLRKRRNELRRELKKHFLTPLLQRDYSTFERIVDELDALRHKVKLAEGAK